MDGPYTGLDPAMVPSVGGLLTHRRRADAQREEDLMEWTKPEFTVVAVTMEVTAYAATK